MEAQVVILHGGEVEVDQDYYELRNIFHREGATQNFIKKRENYVNQRDDRADKYFRNTRVSIEQILNRKNCDVKLALETRSSYHEIPNCREFKKLFDRFEDEIFCWYDVGHAALQSKLGFIESPRHFLNEIKSYIIGLHIHDLKGLRDHLIPGDGGIDFSFLKELLKREDILKVLEIHPGAEHKKVKSIKNFLNFFVQ